MSVAMEQSLIYDMPAAQYHADPCEVPSLSKTIAHILVTRSPLQAWRAHPRLGRQAKKVTEEMEWGTVLGALILGADPGVDVIDAKDFRTADAKAQRDASRDAGRVPLLVMDWDTANEDAETVERRLKLLGVTFRGQSEVACFWYERVTLDSGKDVLVPCRARLDHWDEVDATIYELKNTHDAHPAACAKTILNQGYDIQHAAYRRAVAAVRPDLAPHLRFVFCFFEKDSPDDVTLIESGPRGGCAPRSRLSGSLTSYGERRWLKACGKWAKCVAANDWPGYEPAQIECPVWALNEEVECRIS